MGLEIRSCAIHNNDNFILLSTENEFVKFTMLSEVSWTSYTLYMYVYDVHETSSNTALLCNG